MKNVIKSQIVMLVSLFTALTLTLVACGGGGSSTGGGSGGSGATLSGTVNGGVAAIESQTGAQQLFTVVTGLLIRTAHAGVMGVQVDLYKDGTLVATQITDSDGGFVFTELESGTYSVMLSKDGAPLGESPPIPVDGNIKVELSVNAGLVKVEVEAEGNQLAGEVDDNNGNDLTSSDDQSSDSNDDESSGDDQSSDLGSSDQNGSNV